MRIYCEWIPEEDETLRFAAEEAERYLARMLRGAGELRISLACAAECPADEAESFQVKLDSRGGKVHGNCARAVLLGVYDLLRRLGCRFLAPGAENELVPEISPEALRLDYEQRARFFHRGVCIEGANSREHVLDFIDWLPKLGFNSFFFQFRVPYVFYARWYEHRLNPELPSRRFLPEEAQALMQEAEGEIHRRGLMLHKVGHGWTSEVLGYPGISWDEAGPLAEELRPLAAECDGRRGLFRNVPLNTNLCLSQPEAVERFVELVVNYAQAHPNVAYLHVWLADAYNNICECPACRATTPGDQYVALLNAIDARLTQRGLGTRLVFLIYQELLWPPLRERLRHPERFVLMFAPISRSFASSFAGEKGEGALPPYRRNRIRLPESLAENLRFLRGWQEVFAGDSFVYDYPLGRAHYGDFGNLHIARCIYDDIGALRELGLNGYMSCQELRAGMPNFLPNYVMGRALLDGEADFDELVREYFLAAYGEDWQEAHALLSALSACELCDYVNAKGPRVDATVAQKLARVEALCAQPVPGGSGTFRELLCEHRKYVRLLAAALRAQAEGDETRSEEAYGAFLRYVRREEPRLQRWIDGYRVIDVCGNYSGLKEAGEGRKEAG